MKPTEIPKGFDVKALLSLQLGKNKKAPISLKKKQSQNIDAELKRVELNVHMLFYGSQSTDLTIDSA